MTVVVLLRCLKVLWEAGILPEGVLLQPYQSGVVMEQLEKRGKLFKDTNEKGDRMRTNYYFTNAEGKRIKGSSNRWKRALSDSGSPLPSVGSAMMV